MNEALKIQIDNEKDLDRLFTLWKEAHKNEKILNGNKSTYPKHKGTPPDYKDTSPDFEDFKTFFYNDGLLSKEGVYNKILIIARESNATSDINKKEMETVNYFFFRDGPETNNIIKKFLEHTRKIFKMLDLDNYVVKECAFMNLNKRGGYGSCDHTRLKNYVEEYKDFIIKEISLLNPEIIICYGTYGTIKEILPPEFSSIKIWDCYHFSSNQPVIKNV